MSLPPELSPEQRKAALDKAATARRERAKLKEKLKMGSVNLTELFELATRDEVVGKTKVVAVLESLPGLGKVKARRLMESVGISGNRRIQGLGANQRLRLLKELREALILVVSGPGGVGKGTIVSRLAETVPGLWVSRSWTTRPRRPGEPEDAYTFVDRAAFEARAGEGGFLEWAELGANGELYGTPWPDAPGANVVLEIDVQGAAQVLERHTDAVVVLIVAPSPDEQAARMRRRGDDEGHVASRMDLGRQEEEMGRRLASHVVVNADLDRAVDEVAAIFRAHRHPPAPAS